MSDELDVVVVGAGSAGLAAAKTALSLGLSVQIVEAKDRIGGRAFTDEIAPGMPWDPGAYWLHHGEDNYFVKYAAEAGFAFDEMPRHSYMWSPTANGGSWASDETLRERDAYYDAAFEAIDQAGLAGRDVPASEVIPSHPRFGPMFESWYAALSGAEPEFCSTLDQSRYRDGVNYRVRPGYGALLAAYGKNLPVSLGYPVERIVWSGRQVRVETVRGALTARAVIVTTSTSVIAKGMLRFDPDLPADIRDAFANVPLGTAEKVAIAFDRDVFGLPDNSHVQVEHASAQAVRFQIKPGGFNIAIGYMAGRFAAELEAQGTEAMADFTERHLVDVFGSDIRRARIATGASHWRSDPYIGGGYSFALPGAAEQRLIFRQPLADRIFFAGEACSTSYFGTVNGAYESGVTAAHAVQRALRAAR